MSLNRKFQTAIFVCISILCLTSFAVDDFTNVEQHQISVETPGLFSHSNAFLVDFAQFAKDEYSFPLPVGKITNVTSSDITIESSKGDAVKAMFGGMVRLSRHIHDMGNVIVVRHDNGLETVYGHNAQNLVKVGQRVKAGQTIAIIGEEGGRGSLLFSIMVNGCKINPEIILDLEAHALHRQVATFTKAGKNVNVTTTRKEHKKKEPEGMSMDTNDPFGDKSVYRLDLTAISSWHYPLQDSHVISGYGGRRRHSGVDIKNAPNREVYAAFDGLVVTRYSHNNKNYVNVGDKVKAGDVIGTTGRTGRATTEHLHFETRIAGRAFDPAFIFDHVNHCLQKCVLQFKKNGSVKRLK